MAQYQSLTVQPQKVEAKPFRLGVQEAEANYEPSNVGIIGIKYLHKPGQMSTVIEVYPHTPAAELGVQVGDRLLEVNRTNIIPFNSEQVFALIAGLPGTSINLKFMRCNAYGSSCYTYARNMVRMDMNALHSDKIFRIYRYGG